MDEQRIWAPWRIGYISGEAASEETVEIPRQWFPGSDPECFLCRVAALYSDQSAADKRHLVVGRGTHTLAMLNRYPYTNGHLLVSPLRHVGPFGALTKEEHLEAMHWLTHFCDLLGQRLAAEGFNVGLNLGRVAGAGVPGHLHWHLVPRWPGDNNFMPTLAGARVIPQSLTAVWDVLVHGSSAQSPTVGSKKS